MRIRNLGNAKEVIESCPFVIKKPEEFKGKYQTVFENNNPIYLEIGMGKGNFLLQNAINNPNINFIGVERYDTIVAKAILKIEEFNLPNLKIIQADAIILNTIFDHEIDLIYLNFSDPWPKKRHAKRRLTSEIFLKIYDGIFKANNIIIQKTDNLGLFESSLESLQDYGYEIIDINRDLLNSDMINYKTEYEEKFSKKGFKINYLKAVKKGK